MAHPTLAHTATAANGSSRDKDGEVSATTQAPVLTTPHPSRHPSPTTKATTLGYLIFERPDLDLAEKYLTDFGLRVVSRDADRLFLRGTGEAPYCYVVVRAELPRFAGLGFTVASLDDLRELSRIPGASAIEDIDWPGGGQRVRLIDPAGFRVDAVWGQTPAQPLAHRAPIALNAPDRIVRVNDTQRPPVAPPEVIRLGHILLEVADYQATCAWYTQHLGLIPSDVQLLPDGSPAATFFRLDLGDTPADHHSLAIAQGFMPAYGHSAFEVVDADAVGMGQRVLRERRLAACLGHRPAHPRQPDLRLLGGPLGQRSTSTTATETSSPADAPTGVHPVSREAMSQWGQPMPRSSPSCPASSASREPAPQPGSHAEKLALQLRKIVALQTSPIGRSPRFSRERYEAHVRQRRSFRARAARPLGRAARRAAITPIPATLPDHGRPRARSNPGATRRLAGRGGRRRARQTLLVARHPRTSSSSARARTTAST